MIYTTYMEKSTADTIKDMFKKAKNLIRDAFVWKLVVRQKFGATAFSIPVILLLIVTLIAPHLVLIAVLIALIVGYRLSFERK